MGESMGYAIWGRHIYVQVAEKFKNRREGAWQCCKSCCNTQLCFRLARTSGVFGQACMFCQKQHTARKHKNNTAEAVLNGEVGKFKIVSWWGMSVRTASLGRLLV